MEGKKYEVSFIDCKVGEWLEEMRRNIDDAGNIDDIDDGGFCIKKFHADFTVDNSGNQLNNGSEITVGNETYMITKAGKRCFSDCALRKKAGKPCPLAFGVFFGEKKDKTAGSNHE